MKIHFKFIFHLKIIHSRFTKTRLNLTLNRDKDLDDSQDEFSEEINEIKAQVLATQKPKKHPPMMRSRSVLGCDQIGIETLVSMINSGESDSEKEENQQPQPAPQVNKTEPQRIRSNMLRKTGKILNSSQK